MPSWQCLWGGSSYCHAPLPTPNCSLLTGEQLGAQGGCAAVVCPSWKGIGVEVEHTDLLAPAWAGFAHLLPTQTVSLLEPPQLCFALPC